MWLELFFKYTSVVLALSGSVIGIFVFHIHDSLFPDNPALSYISACLLFSLIPAFAGFISGRLIQNLHHTAHSDQLTSLWNSRYFYLQLLKNMEKSKKTKSSFCVAFMDLDDFKIINDTYGHVAGNEVLRGIATILAGNMRHSDIVVRWGGDEFAIIFPDTNLANASALVERLRGMIENGIECREVTMSVGVLLVQAGMEVEQILQTLDDTLYEAKKTKNLVVLNNYSKLNK